LHPTKQNNEKNNSRRTWHCQNNRGKEMAGEKCFMENHEWAVGEYFIQILWYGIKLKEGKTVQHIKIC
jgi:hypothetical protein